MPTRRRLQRLRGGVLRQRRLEGPFVDSKPGGVDLFLCTFCRRVPTFADVWGRNITPPNRYPALITPGTLVSFDLAGFEQPFAAAARVRKQQAAAEAARAARVGANRVSACSVLLAAMRSVAATDGQMQGVLEALAQLDQEGIIDVKGALPKDVRMLRASGETVCACV